MRRNVKRSESDVVATWTEGEWVLDENCTGETVSEAGAWKTGAVDVDSHSPSSLSQLEGDGWVQPFD